MKAPGLKNIGGMTCEKYVTTIHRCRTATRNRRGQRRELPRKFAVSAGTGLASPLPTGRKRLPGFQRREC
jgi:hypothetical protein